VPGQAAPRLAGPVPADVRFDDDALPGSPTGMSRWRWAGASLEPRQSPRKLAAHARFATPGVHASDPLRLYFGGHFRTLIVTGIARHM
jgi:hypothetical protein